MNKKIIVKFNYNNINKKKIVNIEVRVTKFSYYIQS